MLFSLFSQKLSQIESTTKRLEMTTLLADLFSQLQPEDIKPVFYLLQGKLVPKYESKEFQISTKMIIRALSRVLSSSTQPAADDQGSASTVEAQYKKLGDLGNVAQEILEKKSPSQHHQLSVTQVFARLEAIAEESGEGSQERKLLGVIELYMQLDPLSARYVTRIILGKLRLGFSDMTMIDALSWTIKKDKSLSSQIEDAYQKRADIGYIAEVLLTKGVAALSSVKVKVGTPIIPALCQRLNTAAEIIEKMNEVFAEPKYDGTRVQIHVSKSVNSGQLTDDSKQPTTNHQPHLFIRTFTRNLEDSSHMFPELKEIAKHLNCESCILDSEAVGFDTKTDQLLKFQQTMTRKRKHGIEETSTAVPLRFFVFDILEKDGESLIDRPLSQRKAILEKLFVDSPHMVHAPDIRTDDPVVLHEYHEEQLAKGLEGVVIKMVDGVYQSGRKGYSWVKIKESEGNRGKLSDTVDCVVMGYYLAKGARTQFKVGAVLAGVLGKDGNIVTISKVGSGFSEELSLEFIKKAKDLETKEQPKLYQVNKALIPDIWLSPKLVIEVAADELTQSPTHTAGVALRFPRIIKIREDKGWENATTTKEISAISIS